MTWLLTIIMMSSSGQVLDREVMAITTSETSCTYIGQATTNALMSQGSGRLFMYECSKASGA